MEAGHAGHHLLIDAAVDAAAKGFPAAAPAAPVLGRLRDVRNDLLQGGKGVDRARVAGEGDELEQGLVETRQRRARPEGGADLAAQRPLAPQRGGRRDARQG
jgi:hypothetical protein